MPQSSDRDQVEDLVGVSRRGDVDYHPRAIDGKPRGMGKCHVRNAAPTGSRPHRHDQVLVLSCHDEHDPALAKRLPPLASHRVFEQPRVDLAPPRPLAGDLRRVAPLFIVMVMQGGQFGRRVLRRRSGG